jgi:hypothetical protein
VQRLPGLLRTTRGLQLSTRRSQYCGAAARMLCSRIGAARAGSLRISTAGTPPQGYRLEQQP